MEGFTPMEVLTGGTTLSVTNNGLNFNYNVAVKIKRPKYVLLLQNENQKKIAIQACNQEDTNAIVFVKDENKIKNGIRIHNRDIEQTIEALMDWNLDQFNYKVDGVYSVEDGAVIFDLKRARKFTKKNYSKQ